MFSLPQVIENFRQYLLLRTDILQKTVVGCLCDISLPVPPYYKLSIRETRNYSMNSFTRPSGHHDYYKYSLFPRTIRVWNCLLPETIALSYSAFCRAKNYSKFCFKYCNFFGGTQREYSSKPLKHSIVKSILEFKQQIIIGIFSSPKNFSSVWIS